MIETKTEVDALTHQVVEELVGTAGPCITVILPPYRPGEPGKPAGTILKTELQEAAKQLAARKIAQPAIEELLEPLRQFSHEERSLAGSGFARVLFRAPGVFHQFELRNPPQPAAACIVGDCFFIRPFLKSLAIPEKVYVLDLTKKAASLFACGVTGVTPLELPKETPRTLEEALNFDAPDHDLMNRSSAGPSTGAMRGVQFGTGYGRESEHAHLHDYYRAIDRGVSEVLRNHPAPLILAGVEEDTAVYRAVNTYPLLVAAGIGGATMAASEVLRHAPEIALLDWERRTAVRLAEARERFAPSRFTLDLEAILRAAAEARVADLYLDENAQRVGNFEGKIFGGHGNWHNEDLLNVAAVETLLARGAVYPLPSHAIVGGAVAAATLRY
jgi:hypothetical protein